MPVNMKDGQQRAHLFRKNVGHRKSKGHPQHAAEQRDGHGFPGNEEKQKAVPKPKSLEDRVLGHAFPRRHRHGVRQDQQDHRNDHKRDHAHGDHDGIRHRHKSHLKGLFGFR